MHVPAYVWVYILYACFTVTVVLLVGIASALRTAGRPPASSSELRRIGIALCAWLGLMMIAGSLGAFAPHADRPPVLFPFGLLIPIAAGLIYLRTGRGRELLRVIPQEWIVGVQVYRGLGAFFLVLCGLGYLPEAFALPAGFGDVTVGILALPVALVAIRWRTGVVLWNLLGIADLVAAVGTGFLTAPGPFQLLSFDRPNVLMGNYPMVLIPTFAVPLSIVLHAASLKKLALARAE